MASARRTRSSARCPPAPPLLQAGLLVPAGLLEGTQEPRLRLARRTPSAGRRRPPRPAAAQHRALLRPAAPRAARFARQGPAVAC